VPVLPSSSDSPAELPVEIAHVLLIDFVGYSKLLVNEQIECVQELNRIVRSTESFSDAEKGGKLIRVATGDGMALLFFRNPVEPVRCALEIAQTLRAHPQIRLRMGIHSGPVNSVRDVNDSINVAGAGINIAQRVMDCGDAGHILLSDHVATDLVHYRQWQPYLHDLGECEVKHGLRLRVFNLYKDGLGNSLLPEKLRRGKRWSQKARVGVRPVTAPRWPKSLLIVILLLAASGLAISLSIFLRRGALSRRTSSELIVPAPVPAKSIAVLPFQNLSEDKANAYFTDGVQDEILTDLAKVADLKVISRTSVMQYKSGAVRNLREIARALGVSHVLEGSVQRASGRVRVSAQLIDARTDTHLWAEHYERDLADVFAIESEVAEKIVSQLESKLSPTEKAAIEEQPTGDLIAYDLYTQGKAAIATQDTREKENLLEAERLFKLAIARDPDFYLAYYQLARTHDRIYILGIDHTPERLASADVAIKTLLRLRPNAGEGHLALAAHVYSGYLDYQRAREELAVAARTMPNERLVFELTGYIDRRQNRWDDCIANLKRALALDPRNAHILGQIATAYESLRRFDKMADILDRGLTLFPQDPGIRVQRALVSLESSADTKPLHATIQTVIDKDPSIATYIARTWLHLALCERDQQAAVDALAAMKGDGCRNEGIPFPTSWCGAVAARSRGDRVAEREALTTARSEVGKTVLAQPSYAEALAALGLIDAGLGRKEEALREGRRAVELLPVTKDAINGALLVEYLAVIYAWTGEKDAAIKQLEIATKIPCDINYGQLKLHPYWDPLRGDRRFDKIVASLAPGTR